MERQSPRQYTADFKAHAVSLAESLGAAGAARKIGISSKTLANWIALARAGGVVGNGKRHPVSDLEAENARLKAETAQLRMERDFFLKNVGVLHSRVQVKYASIASQRTHYPIGFMCRILSVLTSGFFAWQTRQRTPRADADALAGEAIMQVHKATRRHYGRRRVTHALRAQSWSVNPKGARRLMREQGLRGVRKGRFVPRTINGAHRRAIAPNVLQRRFTVGTTVAASTSNITYVATQEGGLYLAVTIALKTRQVLGYSLSDRMPDELVLNTLRNARHCEAPSAGTVFHSERGGQYASDDFRDALGVLGTVASMGRNGNCWDNAVSESLFASLKAEEVAEPCATKQDARRTIAQYIHGFCNPSLLHSSLGYLSLDEHARRMQQAAQIVSMRSAA